MERLEDNKLNLHDATRKIQELDLKEDTLKIKDYLTSRLNDNDALKILDLHNKKSSPAQYTQLYECPATSIVVERSFSMLKRMLRVDRNFTDLNINASFISYNNTRTSMN